MVCKETYLQMGILCICWIEPFESALKWCGIQSWRYALFLCRRWCYVSYFRGILSHWTLVHIQWKHLIKRRLLQKSSGQSFQLFSWFNYTWIFRTYPVKLFAEDSIFLLMRVPCFHVDFSTESFHCFLRNPFMLYNSKADRFNSSCISMFWRIEIFYWFQSSTVSTG